MPVAFPARRPDRPRRRGLALAAALALVLAGCDMTPEPEPPHVELRPVAFADLPGWNGDALAEALPALRASCAALARRAPDAPLGGFAGTVAAGTVADWAEPCAGLAGLPDDDAAVRRYLEALFAPFAVADGDQAEGLFTGYFEPILNAAPAPDGRFTVPIHALPRDHVSVRLGDFAPDLAGRQLVGRVEGSRLVPYHDRGAIEAGAVAGTADVLYWADDPLDVFILQVQGSGIVALPDGTRQRIGFAGHNGRDYVSVGRALIERGALPADRAGWPEIRAWLEENPQRSRETLAINRRYIFFRETDGTGPVGAGGVTLTAGRSLAVDPAFVPLGVPLWLDAAHPDGGAKRLQRLMVAQDTGNAIRGVVRGDFFWGTGDGALAMAGRMKSRGRYYVLLPKALTPTG